MGFTTRVIKVTGSQSAAEDAPSLAVGIIIELCKKFSMMSAKVVNRNLAAEVTMTVSKSAVSKLNFLWRNRDSVVKSSSTTKCCVQ